MNPDDDMGEATLHLAGTRPAMVPIVNVPWIAMVLLVGVTAELAMIYWKLALIATPLWPVALFVFRKDHNALRILGAWIRTAGLDFRAHWFGGTSIEVFPQTYHGHFRGIPDA
jgi:type IV secretory pathway VirB3-like protein